MFLNFLMGRQTPQAAQPNCDVRGNPNCCREPSIIPGTQAAVLPQRPSLLLYYISDRETLKQHDSLRHIQAGERVSQHPGC